MKTPHGVQREFRQSICIKKSVFSLIVILLLSGCSANSKSSTEKKVDPKVAEICSLVSETWQTFQYEDPTDPSILDILQAGWYLAAEDMKELASQDILYEVYVAGLNDAFNGDYETEQFNAVRQLCGLE